MLQTYLNREICDIIKNYLERDEYYYLSNQWIRIKEPMEMVVKTKRVDLFRWFMLRLFEEKLI